MHYLLAFLWRLRAIRGGVNDPIKLILCFNPSSSLEIKGIFNQSLSFCTKCFWRFRVRNHIKAASVKAFRLLNQNRRMYKSF